MSEWSELTWDDAMQRGYEALSQGEALYEEIAEQGRSNLDIEKHLRRAELKVAQANAWLAMARELAWQRDDYGGRGQLCSQCSGGSPGWMWRLAMVGIAFGPGGGLGWPVRPAPRPRPGR